MTLEDPDGEFARLVTRRTNTQNRVGGRELVALDPQQERLRMEFAVSGLRYAYRSGEEVSDPSKGCDLTDATVASHVPSPSTRPSWRNARSAGCGTLLAADGLNQVVLKEYPDAYPAPLFKNQSKCKVIGSKLLHDALPAAAHPLAGPPGAHRHDGGTCPRGTRHRAHFARYSSGGRTSPRAVPS